jgi:hypothetical protein
VCLGGRVTESGKASEEYGPFEERDDVPHDCFWPKLASTFFSGPGERCFSWEEVS